MSQVPYTKVEILYKRMFQAEKVGDTELQSLIKRELDALITNSQPSQEEIVTQFHNHLKEKCKKTYQDLEGLLKGSLNEVDLVIEVSSLITQSLLIMKKQSFEANDYLKTVDQVELLWGLLKGEVGPVEATGFYEEILSPALQNDVEKSTSEDT